MKQYDRTSKKWIEKEEVKREYKKRQMCKGGKDHDWLLCLPRYVNSHDSVLGLDKVEEYYRIQDEREDMDIAFDERLETIGIRTRLCRLRSIYGRRRDYVCTVCLKHKTSN